MKTKIFITGCIIVIGLYFLFSQNSKDKKVNLPEAPAVSESLNSVDVSGESSPIESSESTAETTQQSENASPLQKLQSKVGQLSMFNQKGLDQLREEAYQAIEESPKEFENFTIEQVENADKNSVESMFFFVEAYAKKHPNPTEGINEILKLEPKGKNPEGEHSEMGERQKQNMTKAFALEVFFDRLEKQPISSSESIGKLEGTVRGLAEKESDLMMVRQSLLVLKNYLGYENDQLKEIIEKRGGPENESFSYSDLLKD